MSTGVSVAIQPASEKGPNRSVPSIVSRHKSVNRWSSVRSALTVELPPDATSSSASLTTKCHRARVSWFNIDIDPSTNQDHPQVNMVTDIQSEHPNQAIRISPGPTRSKQTGSVITGQSRTAGHRPTNQANRRSGVQSNTMNASDRQEGQNSPSRTREAAEHKECEVGKITYVNAMPTEMHPEKLV